MRKLCLFALLAALATTTGVALGHWDPGTDAKWIQLPDLTPMGIDINASPFSVDGVQQEYILADDWLWVGGWYE